MKPTHFAAAILAGSAILAASPVMADDPIATQHDMTVSLRVYDECTISTTNLTFPAVGIIASAVDGAASVTVRCTNDSPFEVGLSAGLNSGVSPSVANRHMLRSSGVGIESVKYDLYTDSQRTAEWGNTVGDDTYVVESAQHNDMVIPVYGQIEAGQNVPAASYEDTITATVWYAAGLTPTP